MSGKSRFIIIFSAALVPLFLFLNIYQAYEYENLRKEVSRMEVEESEILEANKKLLTGIAILSSPSRILALAQKELDMKMPTSEQVIKFFLKRQGEQ